jgi:hypothetical protein
MIADEAKSVTGKLVADPRAAPKKKKTAGGDGEDVIVDF